MIEGRQGLQIALNSALQTEQSREHVSTADADGGGERGETVLPTPATTETQKLVNKVGGA